LPRDYDTAERWLLLAEKRADPQAPFYLGLIREKRDSDPEAAMRWFEIGAKREDPLAQYKVAVSQLQEARKDKVQAYAWLVVAAE
jgi:TPR repeat protein